MTDRLRIQARPDGEGWIDYRYNGILIGSSKPGLARLVNNAQFTGFHKRA